MGWKLHSSRPSKVCDGVLKTRIGATATTTPQGFFSKFLMGGGLKIFCPTKLDGGGLAKKNPTEAKTAHLMQN